MSTEKKMKSSKRAIYKYNKKTISIRGISKKKNKNKHTNTNNVNVNTKKEKHTKYIKYNKNTKHTKHPVLLTKSRTGLGNTLLTNSGTGLGNTTNYIQTTLKNHKHTKTYLQKGGIFGLNYIKLKIHISKYKNLIVRLNKFDAKVNKEIASSEQRVKLYENNANKKAKLQTEFINNYRAKIILQIYQQDKTEAPESDIVITKSNQDTLANINNNLVGIDKRISQIDKDIREDMPEFNRLYKLFSKNLDTFTKINEDYGKFGTFQQEIENLREKYDLFLPNKKTLSSKDKQIITKYEKNKVDYDYILTLTKSDMEKRRKVEQKINDFFQKAQYFADQFGQFSGKRKIGLGILDKDSNKIRCEGNQGLLCEWGKKYEEFSTYLISIDAACKYIKECLEKIQVEAQSCVNNLSTVYKDYKTDSDPQAVTRFENDITHLITAHLTVCVDYIRDLKIAFYNQMPASRTMIDYNSLTAEFNHIGKRLDVYAKIFDKKQTIPTEKDIIKKTKKGGYIMIGGAQPPPQRRKTQAPRTPTCEESIIIEPLTNAKFYKENISNLKNYEFLKKSIKDNTNNSSCFKDLNTIKIICENYFKVWLFFLNAVKNLNLQPTITNLSQPEIATIKYLIAINKLLTNTNILTDEIKAFIISSFADNNKITDIKIPDYFKDPPQNPPPNPPQQPRLLRKSLIELYNQATIAQPDANPITNTWVNDMIYKVLTPQQIPISNIGDNDFFGVLEWDSTIIINPSINPPPPNLQYIPTETNVFNKFYDTCKNEVDANTNNLYTPQPLAPGAPAAPGVAAPAQVAAPVVAPVYTTTIKTIDEALKTVVDIKDEISGNPILYENDYSDLVNDINKGLMKQKELKIDNIANQDKLYILLNNIHTSMISSSDLTDAQKNNYKIGVLNYNNNLYYAVETYNKVISNLCTVEQAIKAVGEVNKLIENNTAPSYAYNEVIKKPEYICNSVDINKPATPAIPATPATPATPIAPTPLDPAVAAKSKNDIPSDSKYTPGDVQTIKNVLYRFYNEPGLEQYTIQRDAIKVAYINIDKLLEDITGNSDKSSKRLGDNLQKMTQLLLELKTIEPKIIDVSVKKDKSIKLNLGSLTINPVTTNFPDSQLLPHAAALEAARKDDRSVFKIFEEATAMNSKEFEDMFTQILLLNAKSPNKAQLEAFKTNISFMSKLEKEENLKAIVEKLKGLKNRGSIKKWIENQSSK
jgi:hypothetical protein